MLPTATKLTLAISFMGRPYEEGKILWYAYASAYASAYAYEQAAAMRRPSPRLPPLEGAGATRSR